MVDDITPAIAHEEWQAAQRELRALLQIIAEHMRHVELNTRLAAAHQVDLMQAFRAGACEAHADRSENAAGEDTP